MILAGRDEPVPEHLTRRLAKQLCRETGLRARISVALELTTSGLTLYGMTHMERPLSHCARCNMQRPDPIALVGRDGQADCRALEPRWGWRRDRRARDPRCVLYRVGHWCGGLAQGDRARAAIPCAGPRHVSAHQRALSGRLRPHLGCAPPWRRFTAGSRINCAWKNRPWHAYTCRVKINN